MDGSKAHVVMNMPNNSSAEPDRLDLRASKDRLREAARRVDPLAPMRRHPLTTVAAAAALGASVASLGASQIVEFALSKSFRSLGRIAGTSASLFVRHLNQHRQESSDQPPPT
jgi:hypothetical protein